eukprot:167013_1
MIELKQFYELPSFFKDIFKGASAWKDELKNKANIRDDKPLMFELGISEEWNETKQQFVDVEHYNEVWFRISEDAKLGFRKFAIFKKKFKEMTSSDFQQIPTVIRTPPSIPANVLLDTRSIIQFFPNKNELYKYYTP